MNDLEADIDLLLNQINVTMANEAKLKKLQFARLRLVSDLRHAICAATALNAESKRLLVVCKDRTLERCWTEFRQNIETIVALSDAMEEQEAFFVQNQSIEDEYHEAKVHLNDLIEPDEGEPDFDRTIFSNNNNGNGGGGGGGEGESKIHRSHLPDIKFQPFDGNYDDWNRFSQMFTKLVGKEKLDAIDKLYYLNQSLSYLIL